MTDRATELEAAVRAQDALIAEAQRLLTDNLRPGGSWIAEIPLLGAATIVFICS